MLHILRSLQADISETTMRHALTLLLSCFLLLTTANAHATDSYRGAANETAHWIAASAISEKQGVVWPSDPRDPKSVDTSMYSGTPGPILFFLEAYRYKHKKEYLTMARRGADALLASIKHDDPAGLYEGLAGSGFTLGEAYLVTRDKKYLEGALRTVEWLKQSAHKAEGGVRWSDETDIISGTAGTGLFLLWAEDHLGAKDVRGLAIEAGDRLITTAQHPASGQLKWMMNATFPAEMPNFSHGTGGVAYFLVTLYQKTGEKRFLEAALAGARYLTSIADVDGEACLIYHDSRPENKKMYYLGWCHGPAGTARFFYRLYQVTKDPQWMQWMTKLATSLTEKRYAGKAVTPGEWDNVSVCCGVTAQAEFYLNMYQLTRRKDYLDFAHQMSDVLLKKATRDANGMRWVQVETRVKPEIAVAQTGLMQGASGIGLWLLHFDAFETGKRLPSITLPDNPFTY